MHRYLLGARTFTWKKESISHGFNEYTTTYRITSLGKDQKIVWTEPPQQRTRRITFWQVTTKLQKPPDVIIHNWEGLLPPNTQFFPKEWAFIFHIRHPNPQIPHDREKPYKCWILTTNGDYVLKTIDLKGKENTFSKDLCTDSPRRHQHSARKCLFEKSLDHIAEGHTKNTPWAPRSSGQRGLCFWSSHNILYTRPPLQDWER